MSESNLPQITRDAVGAPVPDFAGVELPSDLHVEVLEAGDGAPVAEGQSITVHYSGWLYDSAAPDHRGKAFDSSRTGGRPFDFVLGAGEVIPGWDRGVAGMKEGGRRELTIPSRLAYGSAGAPPRIPPDATLVFEIELMDVR